MTVERKSKKYRKDELFKIENYDKAIADTEHIWDLHHRLELTLDGEFAHSSKELKRLGMYYHRPYFELIFLSHSEHTRLHKKRNQYGLGKHPTDKTRKKLSKALLNKPKSSFGKKYYDHFGYSCAENPRQYNTEWQYWKTNGKCRWEQ